MTAQERLTEEYTPEGDPAYTFIFKDTDGKETTVKYYEYDTNFYAAVVEDKVYLVNKMNVKDLDEAYQKMMNPDTEDAEEVYPIQLQKKIKFIRTCPASCSRGIFLFAGGKKIFLVIK